MGQPQAAMGQPQAAMAQPKAATGGEPSIHGQLRLALPIVVYYSPSVVY